MAQYEWDFNYGVPKQDLPTETVGLGEVRELEESYLIPAHQVKEALAQYQKFQTAYQEQERPSENEFQDSAIISGKKEVTFFDTAELDLLKMNLVKSPDRFEIQVHQTATPLGMWDTENILLERVLYSVKEPLPFVERLHISEPELGILNQCKEIPFSVHSLKRNTNINPFLLKSVMSKVGFLVSQYQLKPRCIVTSQRKSIQTSSIQISLESHFETRLPMKLLSSVATDLDVISEHLRDQNGIFSQLTNGSSFLMSVTPESQGLKKSGLFGKWIYQKWLQQFKKVGNFPKYQFGICQQMQNPT